MSKDTYLLSVGEKGKERLAILNDVFSETSQCWLLKSGLKKNQCVLEIGCGTGNMTSWIANEVGPDGHVYALDASLAQIEIAKSNIQTQHLNNITFINKSIFDLHSDDLPLVDIIYSRFVIMHLDKPFEALTQLLPCLKSGGKLVCEEATNAVICCYPFSAVFQKHRDFLLTLSQKIGLDYNFGEKIYSYFLDLNLKNINVNFVQPLLLKKEQKRMLILLVQEVKNNYLKYNIATEDEINQLIIELENFINDDRYLVSFARTTEISGMKI